MVTRHGSGRPSLRRRVAASALALVCGARELHADEARMPTRTATERASSSAPSERTPTPRTASPYVASAEWAVAQLIPSPLLVTGKEHVGGGLRWQLTPLSYSFGIAERPLRTFFISPIARHSGSVELHASPEWACCAPGDASSWLLRAGLRLYLPLLEHGEQLSWSFGAAYYRAAGKNGASLDIGLLTFEGVLGLNVTVSPWLTRREVITALTLRYF